MTDQSGESATVPVEVIEAARKHLHAAAALADGYSKPESAQAFRWVRDLLGDALSSRLDPS